MHKNSSKNEVDKCMLQSIHIFIQGFLFYVSELKRSDKFLISFDVVPLQTFASENKTTCNCYSSDHTHLLIF